MVFLCISPFNSPQRRWDRRLRPPSWDGGWSWTPIRHLGFDFGEIHPGKCCLYVNVVCESQSNHGLFQICWWLLRCWWYLMIHLIFDDICWSIYIHLFRLQELVGWAHEKLDQESWPQWLHLHENPRWLLSFPLYLRCPRGVPRLF